MDKPRTVGCLVRCQSVLVARFGEKAVIGRRVLMGAKSERVGRSLWQEDSHLKTRIGEGDIRACWWLALARRRLSEELCWWEKISERVGVSFRQEGSYQEKCVSGSKIRASWSLALAKRL